MAGHSKWSQIKRAKAVNDQKKAKIFTKILKAIQIAAKDEPNPDFNFRLRAEIERAKSENVPQDNIKKAINKAKSETPEEIIMEAYGQDGIALIIRIITDNKNRAVAEIKNILNQKGAKFAEQGSVQWMFDVLENNIFKAKFLLKTNEEQETHTLNLIDALEDHPDVIQIFTNINIDDNE